MDNKKKKSAQRAGRALASPAALSLLFGSFAGNAATLEPVINDSIGIGSVSRIQTDVQQQQQQQQQQSVAQASGAKPKMLRQLAAAIG
ncbi:hypothetical protein D187_003195 [Cystobacter fuscus DSM 2262]|uniref:Uncharacterized protein n=1 Tax=Cystobacter fuscus (strain ATCC 25194 / DSM 2262 / NBRC 100088 / M29) TaxID=1242864 RepID=S9P823_CYSF2|nr:hypothetical protein [Cystobacter fuscus]EPX59291.1 hypothetical protein D187_003195 [Cystobacter fuscus DSM 2262]